MTIKQVLLVISGTISLGVGLAGIFLPLVPTTGPLLLAAACYMRGSDRLYRWLINHRLLGRYIRSYREHKAMPLKAKIWAIGVLWATLAISMITVGGWVVVSILAAVGVLVTWIIARIPTLHPQA